MMNQTEFTAFAKRYWSIPVILFIAILLLKGWGRYSEKRDKDNEIDQMVKRYHEVDNALADMQKCKKGDAGACLSSGIYYLNGKFVSPNKKKAARFLYRACKLKHPVGCYELGNFWKKGRKAKKYYKKACAMGYDRGCKALKELKRKK